MEDKKDYKYEYSVRKIITVLPQTCHKWNWR